jgi:hypothetical protein
MKKNKKVYVLISEYDYSDDGYSVLGVFSSLKNLDKYMKKKYPEAQKDEYGDYKITEPPNYFTNYTYFTVYNTKLN